MMKRTMVGALALSAALACTPTSAAGNGCAIVVSGLQNLESSCEFTAIGRVRYVAASISGWRIYRSTDNGSSWTLIASSASEELRPTHAQAKSGVVNANAFDRIKLSIVRANESTPVGNFSFQNGVIAATSDT